MTSLCTITGNMTRRCIAKPIASFHHGNGSCVPLAAVADVSNSLLAVMFYANSLLLGGDTAMKGESHPTCGGDGPSVGRHPAAASDVSTTTRNECADMGDSYVISMPAGFRRHLVGKTLIYVFHCSDSAEMRFVGKIAIIQTFS